MQSMQPTMCVPYRSAMPPANTLQPLDGVAMPMWVEVICLDDVVEHGPARYFSEGLVVGAIALGVTGDKRHLDEALLTFPEHPGHLDRQLTGHHVGRHRR